ncbi:MAG: class I SAM-dependent methyltransferase [Streptomycetaceae bacterium]|nr:class I SAM-dependent methyltransferase [Streptomycetaceae bacterium]
MARPVEMSEYIAIDAYDTFEERHAYFPEMMGEMLRRFAADRPTTPKGTPLPCRVLELGAGTGIFTRRLAKQPLVVCTAVEIDANCFAALERTLLRYPGARAVAADSRTYRSAEGRGEFPYIFSSFADHHIRPEDKTAYLDGVAYHLAPDGRFIVGDEFLPDHDADDPDAWRDAVRRYHGHIIDVSLRRAEELTAAGDEPGAHAHRELVKLETAAMESGLARQGDFKVTRTAYERTLTEHGFAFTSVTIGPTDRDDVGGIHVYEIHRETSL